MQKILVPSDQADARLSYSVCVCVCVCVCLCVVYQVRSWLDEIGEVHLKTLEEPEDSLELLSKKQQDFKDFYTSAYVRHTHTHTTTAATNQESAKS